MGFDVSEMLLFTGNYELVANEKGVTQYSVRKWLKLLYFTVSKTLSSQSDSPDIMMIWLNDFLLHDQL